MILTVKQGDVFDIFEKEGDIMCHQVNCLGVMSRGLAKQVKTKYPYVFAKYAEYCRLNEIVNLMGSCLLVPTKADSCKFVANLFGQKFYGTTETMTNYNSVRAAVKSLGLQACICAMSKYEQIVPGTIEKDPITIVIPEYIGSGLAGGDQEKIWGIIINELAPYQYIHLIKVKDEREASIHA